MSPDCHISTSMLNKTACVNIIFGVSDTGYIFCFDVVMKDTVVTNSCRKFASVFALGLLLKCA